jgi:hypothetical protein
LLEDEDDELIEEASPHQEGPSETSMGGILDSGNFYQSDNEAKSDKVSLVD